MTQHHSNELSLGMAVHVDATKTFTTVILTGERYAAIGTAKRNPGDTHNRQVGFDIALSRALAEMAEKLEKGARW